MMNQKLIRLLSRVERYVRELRQNLDSDDREITNITLLIYSERVEAYRLASAIMPEDSAHLYPTINMRGLYVELALKTYLLHCGERRKGHDLNRLARRARSQGLELTDDDWQHRIQKLNELYYRIAPLDVYYEARYPDERFAQRLNVVITPNHASTEEMVERIMRQASALPPIAVA